MIEHECSYLTPKQFQWHEKKVLEARILEAEYWQAICTEYDKDFDERISQLKDQKESKLIIRKEGE